MRNGVDGGGRSWDERKVMDFLVHNILCTSHPLHIIPYHYSLLNVLFSLYRLLIDFTGMCSLVTWYVFFLV